MRVQHIHSHAGIMSRVHILEQVLRNGGEREKAPVNWERERKNESQGQRVIRPFSVRAEKLSGLGDEK